MSEIKVLLDRLKDSSKMSLNSNSRSTSSLRELQRPNSALITCLSIETDGSNGDLANTSHSLRFSQFPSVHIR